MDWLAVLGIVVAILGAVFSGAWFFGYQHYRQRLKESAGKRLEAAQLLFAPKGWAYYLAWLRRVLNNLDLWMGSLDKVGQLFSRCVSLAFIYPFVFLIISWLVNGSATIGNAQLIPAIGSLSFFEWFLTALGFAAFAIVIAIAVAAVAAFAGAVGAVAVAVAVGGATATASAGAFPGAAGAFSFAVAIAGAFVGALVGAVAVAVATGAIALAYAVTGAFSAWLAGTSLAEPEITSWLLFIILLPPINALFDWASWWASRALGRNLVSTLEKPDVTTWRRITTLLRDMLLDIVIAIVLLTMLAYFMPRLIDAWNGFVVMLEGGEAPIDLVDYLCAAARNPLTDGLWATLMLFSTLIPTIGHLGVLIMAFFVRSPSQLDRERAAHLRHQYRPPAEDLKGLEEEALMKWPEKMPADYSIEHISGPGDVPMDDLNVDTVNAVSWNLGVFRWFWYLLAVSAAAALVWIVTPIVFSPWEPLPKLLLMVAGFTWPEAQACFLEAG